MKMSDIYCWPLLVTRFVLLEEAGRFFPVFKDHIVFTAGKYRDVSLVFRLHKKLVDGYANVRRHDHVS